MTDRRPLKIVLAADPELPVPPAYYGGIERIVHMLSEGLVGRGHEVHLLANAASRTSARLIPYQGLRCEGWKDTLENSMSLFRTVRSVRPDVVHSFARLIYMLPFIGSRVTLLQSYQRAITRSSVVWGDRLSRRRLIFTACSRSCMESAGALPNRWKVVYNGVPVERYVFSAHVGPEAPLVFLGRIERIKGAHTAIRVAKAAGRRLMIAGNHASTGREWEYFKSEVLPHCDGRDIVHVGPVNDIEKSALLGGAAALLFPIEWEEPFGIVMAEALACGTPVIGFGRGAVPEVVRHGETGYLCADEAGMVRAIRDIGKIDRQKCRREAEERFSDTVIVGQYESIYYDSLGLA